MYGDETLSSPVILTGRGGSGTRMLSQLAKDQNVFLGNVLNESEDSLEWVDAIYTLAHQQLSTVADDSTEQAPESMDERLTTETINHFHDIAQQVLSKGQWQQGQRWGFKLPECMLVIPELLAIFPNATVVHQYRHPVSSSVRRTHRTSRSVNPLGKQVLLKSYEAVGRDEDLIYTDEPHLRNAYTWSFQVGQVVNYTRQHLPSHRLLELSFESLCQNPGRAAQQLTELLAGTSQSNGTPVSTSVSVDPERLGVASTCSAEAKAVWEICQPVAETLGYVDSAVMPVAA